eukprot:TRINITY_DN242_c0_g1_i1.p1 TRINITY_DN242_c0_g1~~TRINITY_DN242_c0_g1_i1.p1  ORF type:complete len:382 (+),score=63.00 TRINITY_DN242_c0_g1_i1:116-1147(+)
MYHSQHQQDDDDDEEEEEEEEDYNNDQTPTQDSSVDSDHFPDQLSAVYLLNKYFIEPPQNPNEISAQILHELEEEDQQQQQQQVECHQTCSICDEDYDQSNFLAVASCTHSFCQDCLRSYFSVRITSGEVDHKCPGAGCGVDVNMEDLQTLLDADLLAKSVRFKESKRQAQDSKTRYCPLPSCSAANTWLGENYRVECKCGHAFCAECSVDWNLHGELGAKDGCRMARKKMRRRTRKESQVDRAAESWKKKNTQGCPRCGVSIQKIRGCDFMMCTQCKHQFCWKCLDPHNHNLATHKHGRRGRSKRVARRVAIGTGATLAVLVLVIPVVIVAAPYAVYKLSKS